MAPGTLGHTPTIEVGAVVGSGTPRTAATSNPAGNGGTMADPSLSRRWSGAPAPSHPRRRRRTLKRAMVLTASALMTLIVLAGCWIGFSLYLVDRAVHHVGIPASLLARGKNDLLAIVQGPNHSEQIFVFHHTGEHTNVLTIPKTLELPLAGRRTVPIDSLSLRAPNALIAGLDKLGIPVSHYVGVDLHTVSPTSSLGQLALGKMSVSGLMSDPTGTTLLLEQVASHIYLGPGTPVSDVLSLMNVPTAKSVSVPTAKNLNGKVVLTSAFPSTLRGFL